MGQFCFCFDVALAAWERPAAGSIDTCTWKGARECLGWELRGAQQCDPERAWDPEG
jgi:hypothetical protein